MLAKSSRILFSSSLFIVSFVMLGRGNAIGAYEEPVDEGVTSGPVRSTEERNNCRKLLRAWVRAIEMLTLKLSTVLPTASITTDDGISMQVSRTETSVAEYYLCVEKGVCGIPRKKSIQRAGASPELCSWMGSGSVPMHRRMLPMNCIAAAEARTYCNWRGGRLPTVDEWFAVLEAQLRAERFPWGDQLADHELVAVGVNVLGAYIPVEDAGWTGKSLGREVLSCDGAGWRWCELGGPQSVIGNLRGRSFDGLFHLLGNVAEFADTNDGQARALGLSWTGDSRLFSERPSLFNVPDFGDWDTKSGRRELLTDPSVELSSTASPYVGFRCVWPAQTGVSSEYQRSPHSYPGGK